MAGILARLTPAAWLRAPRPTARLRLTLLYGALFLLSGTALLAITYLLFEQVTTAIALPGGEHVIFGNVPGIRSATTRRIDRTGQVPGIGGATTRRLDRTGQYPSKSPSLTHLQAQIAQLHTFEMHELLIRSGIALGLTAILSVALGWLVAGRVLRPVRTISATARHISARNLNERLSLDGPDDEFRELAATLDGLLDRLQASFESQRRFVANASHELRTPLTLDRALLERALLKREPTQAFWRATCERLLVSSQQQDRLIDALLTLARSEAGLSSCEAFELSTVIDSVLRGPELSIGSTGIQIQAEIGPAAVSGDPRLVERLVRNLVDNAIRYNQPSGQVNIAASTQSGHAVLVISNTGPAISAPDLDRLFQPFQRLAPHRSSQADGTGLGLSIVKAIADVHDATITAAAQSPGGLRIEVSFPLPDPRLIRPDPVHCEHAAVPVG
jgi:signal transduction histidine kinase